ncbi:MAG: EAL domain-containing protein [Actinomycetota bacterium]|nr:EAL domain-containing protein [Actinomycetota bacterium]
MRGRTSVWWRVIQDRLTGGFEPVYAARLVAVAVAYFAAAQGGLALASESSSVTAVWPPTGIALAALVVWGRRLWPGVALGAFLANLWTGVPLLTVLGITTGNTLEALVGATLLMHVARFRPSLDRLRDVLALAAVAVVSTMVSATVGVTSLHLGGAAAADGLLSTWWTWWAGDLGGALLVAPFLMVLANGLPRGRSRGRVLEGAAFLLALTLVSCWVFSDTADRTFLIFPLLAWAALRFRQRGVTAGSLIVAAVAAGFTAHGMGPFVQATEDQGLLLSQTFVGVTALVSLVLAAITAERARAEAELRGAAEARFRGVFEGAPSGMAVLGLEGRFEEVNGALCEITGHGREELESAGLELITHANDMVEMRRQMDLLLAGEISSYQTEQRCLHASGDTVWMTLQATLLRTSDGAPVHFLTQMLDITDRRRNEEKLRYMVDHEPLTGLLNRRSFEHELKAHLARARRYGLEGAVVMVDLDDFKQVNDSLGHQAGDELILGVAEALRSRLRTTDVLARLGGDEFVILLPKVGRAQAREVACDLLTAIRNTHSRARAGAGGSISASIGVAMVQDEVGRTSDDLMVSADLAMYDAKEGGRNRIAFYKSDQRSCTRIKGRETWVQRIGSALEEDRFTLLAQPIVELSTGRVTQHELLLRMQDQTGDLIPPAAFLPIAERLGRVRAIDHWVVGQAIAMIQEHDRTGAGLTLEVNLSPRSLDDHVLLDLIEAELGRTGIAPERLIFEVSETGAVANMAGARNFGKRVAELGCRFALDDFGAGFGSFYYLKHLPFDLVKIDGEFVRNCPHNQTDRLLVQAVVDIARGLGKQTVAEVVTDDDALRMLTGLGVHYGQGYHLGRPVPVAELAPSALAEV